MAHLKPPFTLETATQKVKAAQALWNTKDPAKVALAYTLKSVWRNRSTFLLGHSEIINFLTQKWQREKEYRLRKELFSYQGNRIAVQFYYEYRDALDGMVWKRCYGIEHWTFNSEGKMEKRMMSGNDITISEECRWFQRDVHVDDVTLNDRDF